MSIRRKLRYVYELIPFKQEMFSVLRNFWQPGEKLNNFTYFEGDFEVKVNDFGSFKVRNHGYGFLVENELFWRGLYTGHEKLSMLLWTKLCQNSNVIFDVGANTGIYSLTAKTVNPQARVFAFEPVKRVYEKLLANIEMNKFDIQCFEQALSDTNGTATIYDLPVAHVYSVTVGKNIHSPDFETVPTEVEIARLDTVIERQNLKQMDLIKIDVETHEPEVLEGFGKYLDVFRPTILIEILNDEVGIKIEEIVKDKNYLYFNIDDRANSLVQTESIRKSNFYNYLLCSYETAETLGLV